MLIGVFRCSVQIGSLSARCSSLASGDNDTRQPKTFRIRVPASKTSEHSVSTSDRFDVEAQKRKDNANDVCAEDKTKKSRFKTAQKPRIRNVSTSKLRGSMNFEFDLLCRLLQITSPFLLSREGDAQWYSAMILVSQLQELQQESCN